MPPRLTAALTATSLRNSTPNNESSTVVDMKDFRRNSSPQYHLASKAPQSYSLTLQLPPQISMTYSIKGMELPPFLIGVAQYAPSPAEIKAAQDEARRQEIEAHNNSIVYKINAYKENITEFLKIGDLKTIIDFLHSSFADELNSEYLIVEGKLKKTSALIDLLNADIKIFTKNNSTFRGANIDPYTAKGTSKLINYLCSQLNGNKSSNQCTSYFDQDDVRTLIITLLDIPGVDVDACNDAYKMQRPLHHIILSGDIELIERMCRDERIKVERYNFDKDGPLMKALNLSLSPNHISQIKNIIESASVDRALEKGHIGALTPQQFANLVREDVRRKSAPKGP